MVKLKKKVKEKLTSHFLIQFYFIFTFYKIIIALHTVHGALEKKYLKLNIFGLKLNIEKMKLLHLLPSFHGKQMRKKWKQWNILFAWASKSLWTVTIVMKLKDAFSLEEKLTDLGSIL